MSCDRDPRQGYFSQLVNPQELLAGYVLGDLDAQEAAALAQLLTDQPELWADIKTLQATLEVGLPQRLPPLAVREKIVSRRRPWLAVCLGIIAALSLSNIYFWRRLQPAPPLIILMTAPEAPSSRVALEVNPEMLAATLIAENLPPLAKSMRCGRCWIRRHPLPPMNRGPF